MCIYYLISVHISLQLACNTISPNFRIYWRPQSDYAEAACGVIKVAQDWGVDEDMIEKIRSAFRMVGTTLRVLAFEES